MIEIVENSINYIKHSLLATDRPGINNLIKYMEIQGFFEAPCSGGNHLCCKYGLVVHSANVLRTALKIAKDLLAPDEFEKMYDSIVIASTLHDIGKAGQKQISYYVENLVKDGRPTKANPVQQYKQSETKPFMQNKDLLHIEHCIRSIVIIQQYIELTEMEQHAILYHDSLYGPLKYEVIGHETKLQQIIHYADFWVSHFEETKNLTGDPDSEDEEFVIT
jgi:23S rRNA maturation-related 3'-5' exoribonuclease YhaM